MPWEEPRVVDRRIEFVKRVEVGEETMLSLCREYKISAKTGYKWLKRYEEEGRRGLLDQSRLPYSRTQTTGEEQICTIVRLKLQRKSWGPKKIREILKKTQPDVVSLSTVNRILKRAGLVEVRSKRRAAHCGRIENRIQAEQPNDVWTVDFKGYWYSQERKRISPLTVQDAFSRYLLLAEAVPDGRMETVRKSFEWLFERYGLPKTIRTDNGPPFASVQAPLGLSRLSAWWVSLGINLDRIRPGHPEENGMHERMHRDLAVEIEAEATGNMKEQCAALDVWQKIRNEERPHEALGMKVPAELYKRSTRRWNRDEKIELQYPLDYLKRQITSSGVISLEGKHIRISEALSGWQVGMKRIGSLNYSVHFGPLYLGTINLELEEFKPA